MDETRSAPTRTRTGASREERSSRGADHVLGPMDGRSEAAARVSAAPRQSAPGGDWNEIHSDAAGEDRFDSVLGLLREDGESANEEPHETSGKLGRA